jgi:hypothetical protein
MSPLIGDEGGARSVYALTKQAPPDASGGATHRALDGAYHKVVGYASRIFQREKNMHMSFLEVTERLFAYKVKDITFREYLLREHRRGRSINRIAMDLNQMDIPVTQWNVKGWIAHIEKDETQRLHDAARLRNDEYRAV